MNIDVRNGIVYESMCIEIFLLLQMSSPSELFSCVEAKDILQCPSNTSTAKHHWTFAKDARYRSPRPYCDSFYSIKGMEDNHSRKTGIGLGKKTDLQFNLNPENHSPAPLYSIPDFVKQNKLHHTGFTPGFSRQDIAPMSYINLQALKVPGPGRYEEYKKTSTPLWTMHQRVSSEIFPQSTAKIVPGPGQYPFNQEINRTGRYLLSKHRSSRAKVFNPAHSTRFNQTMNEVPGPGNYAPKNDLSNEGCYVLSKDVSAGKRTFMEGMRRSFIDLAVHRSQTPGPGSYRTPSDFGHYDSKNQRIARTYSHLNNSSRKTARTRNTQQKN